MTSLMLRRGKLRSNPYVAFNPLSVSFSAAFWTSGPEFVALGLANGAAVATWPDEIGTSDATQATGGSQPTYQSLNVAMNNRPVVSFDGVDDVLRTAAFGAAMSQPNEIVMVCRNRTTGTNAFHSGIVVGSRHVLSRTASNWQLFAGTAVTGGTPDTARHYFDEVYDTTDTLTVDGTQVISGDAGAQTLTGLSIGGPHSGTPAAVDIAFIGVADSLLTSQNRSDLLAWSRAFYDTP